ncbi:unnamed protein product [Rangifer tarandus platyrhynchus]|uniref:Uncharacterized protein n=1 Tax=Rangifer tarandus platyrhynchus TaxID=3082113 RepID=A0ABN8ZPY5_RANTA|nr:unnamed protein product [Rangifer tarandus platyrhynchus]
MHRKRIGNTSVGPDVCLGRPLHAFPQATPPGPAPCSLYGPSQGSAPRLYDSPCPGRVRHTGSAHAPPLSQALRRPSPAPYHSSAPKPLPGPPRPASRPQAPPHELRPSRVSPERPRTWAQASG